MTHKFLLLFIASFLFVACGDESPMSAANNEISEKEKQHEQEQKERELEKQRQEEKGRQSAYDRSGRSGG